MPATPRSSSASTGRWAGDLQARSRRAPAVGLRAGAVPPRGRRLRAQRGRSGSVSCRPRCCDPMPHSARDRCSGSSTPISPSTTSRCTPNGPTSTTSCGRSPCSTPSPTTPTARAGTACSSSTATRRRSRVGDRQRAVLLGRRQAAHRDLGVRRRAAARRPAPRRGEAPSTCRRTLAALLDDDEIDGDRPPGPTARRAPRCSRPSGTATAIPGRWCERRRSARHARSSAPTSTRSVRLVDDRTAARDWAGLRVARDRCRAAVATGRQLWPAATLAEYRLALVAPPEWAAPMIADDAGLFTIGPLTEVIAQHHTWAALQPAAASDAGRRVRRPRARPAR